MGSCRKTEQLNRGASRGDGVLRSPKGQGRWRQPAPLSPVMGAETRWGPDTGRAQPERSPERRDSGLPASPPGQGGWGREPGSGPPRHPSVDRAEGQPDGTQGRGPRSEETGQHPRVSAEDSGLLRCRRWWSWLTVTPQFAVHTHAGPGARPWVRSPTACQAPGTVPALEEAPQHLRRYETMSRAPPPASSAQLGLVLMAGWRSPPDCRHPQSPIHMSLVKQELALFILDPHPLQPLNCPPETPEAQQADSALPCTVLGLITSAPPGHRGLHLKPRPHQPGRKQSSRLCV